MAPEGVECKCVPDSTACANVKGVYAISDGASESFASRLLISAAYMKPPAQRPHRLYTPDAILPYRSSAV